MTTQSPPPDGIDITRPNVARIYDYLLGGLRGRAGVLRHPDVTGLLDLTRPVAVLCTSAQTIGRSRLLCLHHRRSAGLTGAAG